MYYQQGDILLAKVDSIPSDLVRENHPRENNKRNNELAYGEAHGHCHRLVGQEEDYEILHSPTTKERYLRIVNPVMLSHEEHKTQTIDKGLYKFGQVQEYDPFEQYVRSVID